MLLFTTDPTDDYPELKEYTKEELFSKHCEYNLVPDAAQNYIDELESKMQNLHKIAKKIKSLQSIESILDNDQSLRLRDLQSNLIKNLTKNRL